MKDLDARAESVFTQVIAAPGEQRRAMLDDLCDDDAELRAEVESLLAFHDESHVPLDASPSFDTAAASGQLPDRIGEFRVLDLLGAGGMGVVYKAESHRPRRTVALKVLRQGLVGSAARRFEHEAHLLARLRHPSIAQIYEVGTTPTEPGESPFFAMELVRGETLTRFAQLKKLGTRERLRLIAEVCDGIQHAHLKGVVHRDLKPGNILIDEDGAPKILDFGIARATDTDLTITTMRTDVGQLIGTVAYMSPEQAAADAESIDARSDVYSLGVVMYELLAGRLPVDVRERPMLQAVRAIREEDPTPLSSVDRAFRGDVETIVGKALDKDPTRRYQSAAELAADIRRYLNDEPIAARPPSTAYQLGKFARRNKGFVGAVAVVFLVMAAGIVAFAWQARVAMLAQAHAETEQERAEDEAAVATSINAFFAQLLEAVNPLTAKGTDPTVREILDLAVDRIDEADNTYVRASLHLSVGRTYLGLGAFDEAKDHLNRCLSLLEQDDRVEDDAYLDAAFALAEVHFKLNEEVESAEVAGAAWDIAIATRDPEDRRVLALRTQVLLASEDMDPEERISQLRDHADTLTRVFGPTDHDSLLTVDALGIALLQTLRYEEAEAVYRDMIPNAIATYGEDDVQTNLARANLADVLHARGAHDEAIGYYEQAVESTKAIFGPVHANTLSILRRFATALRAVGRFTEAAETLENVALIMAETYGERHPATMGTKIQIGATLTRAGDPASAEPIIRDWVEWATAELGPEDPNVISNTAFYAKCLEDLGRYEESEQIMIGLIETADRIMPETFWLRGLMHMRYGALLLQMDQLDASEQKLLNAYDMLSNGDEKAQRMARQTIPVLVELYEKLDNADERDRWAGMLTDGP